MQKEILPDAVTEINTPTTAAFPTCLCGLRAIYSHCRVKDPEGQLQSNVFANVSHFNSVLNGVVHGRNVSLAKQKLQFLT